MRRSLAKFSESEASNHTPSLADFTTITPELKSAALTEKGSLPCITYRSYSKQNQQIMEDKLLLALSCVEAQIVVRSRN
jgi:hypothetical protein